MQVNIFSNDGSSGVKARPQNVPKKEFVPMSLNTSI